MTDLDRVRSRRMGYLCLVVTSVGWGLNWPAMKHLLSELPPLFARGSAGLVAALVFALVCAALGQSLRVPGRLFGRLAAASFINVSAWMGFSTLAMQWLSAGEGALLVYTMPVWATLLAWPILGHRPTLRSFAGLAVCLSGLWVLFARQGLHIDAGQLTGVMFALAAAFLFALGTVALRPLAEMAPFALLAWQLGLGCLPMVVLGLLFEHPNLTRVSATGWALMAYMTAVPMGVCYLSWFAALRRLPPATASIATLLTPVVGVGAAAIALGEPFGGREVAALFLTLAGVGLALQRNKG